MTTYYMLQFSNKLSSIVMKYNHDTTVSVICDDHNILEMMRDMKINVVKKNSDISNFVIMCEYDINFINKLLEDCVVVCLIVRIKFDFNGLVKSANCSNIDAIMWNDDLGYYFIVLS